MLLCDLWSVATGVVAKLQVEIGVNPIFTGERESQWLAGWHYWTKADTFPISVKEQRINWMRWPTISKGTPTWCGLNWNVSRTSHQIFIDYTRQKLMLSAAVWHCITTLSFSEAMEQSMPKDDVANRSSVDFRIQKTQVRKQTADSSHVTYPAHTWSSPVCRTETPGGKQK